jgi:hypothetical protein
VKKVVEQMSQSNAIAEKMSYEQKKKAQYFMTLDRLDASFPKYEKAMEIQETIEKSPLTSSTKEERPITTISYLEIANGILVYLSRFTYLSRDTLIKHIGKVIGTDEKDVDFRLLFQRAENCLLEKNLIKADEGRLAKVRY